MIGIFTCRKYISNSPWTKQTHLAKSSELELHTWTLVIDGTLRDTADFVSALVNVYNFEISELLVFIVIVSLYLFVPEIACGGDVHFVKVARLWKHASGRFFYNSFKISLAEVSLIFTCNFSKPYLNGYFSIKLLFSEKTVPEQVKKRFLIKKEPLRSLFKVNDKRLDRIISDMLTLSKYLTCNLIETFCFAHVEHFWTCLEGIYIQLIIITSC